MQSIFIDGYKKDYWKHAYREHYKKEFASLNVKQLIPKAIEYLETQMKKLMEKFEASDDEESRNKLKAQISAINEKIKLYNLNIYEDMKSLIKGVSI